MLLGIHGLKSCHLSSKDPQHMSPAPGVSIAGREVQGRVVGVLCPASPPVERQELPVSPPHEQPMKIQPLPAHCVSHEARPECEEGTPGWLSS